MLLHRLVFSLFFLPPFPPPPVFEKRTDPFAMTQNSELYLALWKHSGPPDKTGVAA